MTALRGRWQSLAPVSNLMQSSNPVHVLLELLSDVLVVRRCSSQGQSILGHLLVSLCYLLRAGTCTLPFPHGEGMGTGSGIFDKLASYLQCYSGGGWQECGGASRGRVAGGCICQAGLARLGHLSLRVESASRLNKGSEALAMGQVQEH